MYVAMADSNKDVHYPMFTLSKIALKKVGNEKHFKSA